ncbi:MAG TPA: hypothetical protein PLV61_17420 [Parvularculaceae bacterium]|nr:hypothetical protein [Caulobacterales bacterium]HOP20154.1 hypothetical protein [Amphiplicatus sp.]HPE32979.1 hypothetical protein [Parvularculaceae bacterium]
MLTEVTSIFGETYAAPTAPDRRATRRFVDAWTRAARGRYPSWRAMREIDLGEDWNWAFSVDLQRSSAFPYFIYLGSSLAKLSDIYLPGGSDWMVSLLEKATTEIGACVIAETPIEREDELILANGRRLLFRSVTAPLADNGRTISHVAGVVNGTLGD